MIVLAIGFAIGGTILLSAEEQTNTVTKYKMVTDVTGLFDTDESPEYIDYDLSQNYTGYFTTDTVMNGVNYWGGATFSSTSVNNYPVRFAPEDSLSNTVDISSVTTSNPGGLRLAIAVYGFDGVDVMSAGTMGNLVENWSHNTKCSKLTDLISDESLEDYNQIIITPISDSNSNRILFASIDDFIYADVTNPYYWRDFVEYDARGTYTQSRWAGTTADTLVACQSCKINPVTGNVDMYYGTNADNSTFYRTVELSKAVILFGSIDETDYQTAVPGFPNLVKIDAIFRPSNQYMDISRGVTVTGVTV